MYILFHIKYYIIIIYYCFIKSNMKGKIVKVRKFSKSTDVQKQITIHQDEQNVKFEFDNGPKTRTISKIQIDQKKINSEQAKIETPIQNKTIHTKSIIEFDSEKKSNKQQPISEEQNYFQNKIKSLIHTPTPDINKRISKWQVNEKSKSRFVQNMIYLNTKSSKSKIKKPRLLPRIIPVKSKKGHKSQASDYEQEKPTKKLYLSNFISSISKQDNKISFQYEHASFYDLYLTIPRENYLKSEQNLRYFAYRCHKFNSFFKKLEYLSVVEFLKNCNIVVYQKNQCIYDQNTIYKNCIIILWGKIQLINQNMGLNQIHLLGATLNEEYILCDASLLRKKYQTVKALENTGVLQIEAKNLTLIKNELVQLYLRSDLLKIEQTLKKNYLLKRSYKIKKDNIKEI